MLRKRRAGEATLAWHVAGLAAVELIQLSSPSFEHGAPIPLRHAAKGLGDNLSPALDWSGVPAEAQQLVLIVEDPDVPLRRPIAHAVVTGIPPKTNHIDEGAMNEGELFGAANASFGRRGYSGPRPIAGHGPHSYVWQLFALDTVLDLPKDLKPDAVVAAASGHVIARGRLDGTVER